MKTKQVIILRTDLKYSIGEKIAQAACASMKVFFDMTIKETQHNPCFSYSSNQEPILLRTFATIKNDSVDQWMEGELTKEIVGIDSLKKLLTLHEKAKERGILTSLVKDVDSTEFNKSTYTCVAIGPDESDKIDEITGNLKLL